MQLLPGPAQGVEIRTGTNPVATVRRRSAVRMTTQQVEPECLALEGLAHAYADGTRSIVGVDLALTPGEFVALVGPSGCGKSTLLRLVAGLLRPDAGTLRGVHRRQIGFVFQSPTLLPWRTVADNVGLPLELRGTSAPERASRVGEMLRLVGLEEWGGRFPAQLSGGMRMRVSIARALVARPRLLLMDEPFAALDDMTRSRLQEELLALREREGFATLFVTHNVAESVFLADRVLCLSARPGRILGEVRVPFGTSRDPELRTDARAADLCRRVSRLLAEAAP